MRLCKYAITSAKLSGVEAVFQAAGHQRDVARLPLVNFAGGNADLPALDVDQLNDVLTIGLDDARIDAARGRHDRGHLIGFGDAIGGFEHRANQLGAGVAGADAGQVGPDFGPLPADRVAFDAADSFGVGEERVPSGHRRRASSAKSR